MNNSTQKSKAISMHKIAETIKVLRRKNGWTHTDAAVKLQIPTDLYVYIETGKADVTLKTLTDILDLYNLSILKFVPVKQEKPVPYEGKLYKRLKFKDDLIYELEEKVRFKDLEINRLQNMLEIRSSEVIDLQVIAIKLYEEYVVKADISRL